ncbi:MAG: hypothetical protein PHD95_05430 [Candidatus ainarchaeum sp.]|nr:hypothetical protein [Candidatus ainarchaeum sp.]
MAEFFLNAIIFSNPIITWLFFIGAYAILGGGIKYIDDAFDEKVFRTRNAVLFAPILGIFWFVTMILSPESATILGAIVIAVFLKGKIDNIAHQLGIISIFFLLFIFGFFNFLWIPMLILIIAGLFDELGNDYVDKHLEVRKPIWLFFKYRFVMKIAVLCFVLLGIFAPVYFFAFLAFDIAYALITKYSAKLAHMRKFYYHKRTNGV